MKKILIMGVLLAVSHVELVLAQSTTPLIKPVAATTELGTWVTASGNLEVNIAPCGSALCGKISRVISTNAMTPGVVTTVEPARLLGLTILSNLVRSDGIEWRGKIYNRDKDKTYDCVVELQSPNELKVRGYQFLPLFGSTQIWHRVRPV